ncbi:phosphoribosyltransferase [Kitasatospora purpeofusca]|uniref:phosphoribosyltransferase n=1 Tax=Kitasatospora purpeofusca TaxID=67352 RepID=UPI0022547433|nr:phosphoribosyltransferase family protein [Kitasatospora purpeofusca]MCX4758660.1 phosphoribosyltransferase domain-containing protein [Kitasatospora purpeofusca]WSR30905.1 phosphoribosyltransferase domain-containing protein [Kitasatospora purpeofusca]
MTATTQPSGQRRFTRTAPYAPTPYQCTDAARLLAESTIGSTPAVTCVIGIASGGIRPATVVADYLQVPLHTVTARHNTSDAPWQQATGEVEVLLPERLPDRFEGRILLVDDIAGSGATFTAVTRALTGRLTDGAVVETLALCRNQGCTDAPARWIWTVDDWVVFPSEQAHAGDTRVLPPVRRVMTP